MCSQLKLYLCLYQEAFSELCFLSLFTNPSPLPHNPTSLSPTALPNRESKLVKVLATSAAPLICQGLCWEVGIQWSLEAKFNAED